MADFSKFFIVNDDGYPSLSFYANDDDDSGKHVRFADAGTTLQELVDAAESFDPDEEDS